jgi:hypothetical protein
VRASLAIVLLVAVAAGCRTSSGEQRDGAASSVANASAGAASITKCVDRLLTTSTASGGSEQQLRRYIRDTYCALFEQNGWVYKDGALNIAAEKWLDKGGSCATGSNGEPTLTVPCEQTNPGTGTRVIDCALLHHVRRREVIAYIANLRRTGEIQCDDGTPLDKLGVR